jgi:hypothetical protein
MEAERAKRTWTPETATTYLRKRGAITGSNGQLQIKPAFVGLTGLCAADYINNHTKQYVFFSR